MKRYTDKVRQGILLIEANMEIFASDKRDEGDKERADAVDAALAWIASQQRRVVRNRSNATKGEA